MVLVINNIIFEDENILIVNKPFGTLCCPDKKGEQNLQTFFKTLKNNQNIEVINRLDRAVGGIVVFTKTKNATAFLTDQIKNNKIKKTYLAIVCGKSKEEDNLTHWLMKNQRLNISKIVNKNSPGSKEAKLTYKKIKTININNKDYSLLSINLQTGRHHQIRAQMSHVGLPLYNDTKYNKNIKRKEGNGHIGLFCSQMEFINPSTNNEIKFTLSPTNEQMFSNFYI